MPNWSKPKAREEEKVAEPVAAVEAPAVDAPAAESSFMVRDSLGNPIGRASSPSEAREKQIQAAVDAREAA